MKKLTTKDILTLLKQYVWMTFAGMLNAISLYAFVNPSHLIAGGFSGLSSVLTYVIYPLFPNMEFESVMPIVYWVLNVPLMVCSLIFLRGDFTFKTIWATVVCTLTLAGLAYFPQLQFTDSRLIAVIFGGILIGLAMYIAAEHNGSNGGTEVIAKIVAKYHPEIDLSKVVMVANYTILVGGSIVVMTTVERNFAIVLYSILYILIGSNVFGMFRRGFNHPQKYLIVTTEYEQMVQEITTYFKRGCSCVDVVNNDSDAPPRKMVMVIVQYRQIPHLKRLIKRVDPHAFTFVKDVQNVFSRPTFNRSYKL